MLIKKKRTLGEVLTKDIKVLRGINEALEGKNDILERRITNLERTVKKLLQSNRKLQNGLVSLRSDLSQSTHLLNNMKSKLKA